MLTARTLLHAPLRVSWRGGGNLDSPQWPEAIGSVFAQVTASVAYGVRAEEGGLMTPSRGSKTPLVSWFKKGRPPGRPPSLGRPMRPFLPVPGVVS